MSTHHQEILRELKAHANQGTKHSGNAAYLGNAHFSYRISVPIRQKIVKDFLANHNLSKTEVFRLIHELYRGRSHDEKSIAGSLLFHFKTYRAQMPVGSINVWLGYLDGWAEVDSLCQSVFGAEDILSRWAMWKSLIVRLSKDTNPNKRRASLVLLTRSAGQSSDKKISKLAFTVIDTAKNDRDILITKAVSWLLRSLVRHHREDVVKYIKRNESTLPKIVLRETRRKLLTGKKN